MVKGIPLEVDSKIEIKICHKDDSLQDQVFIVTYKDDESFNHALSALDKHVLNSVPNWHGEVVDDDAWASPCFNC